MLLVKRFVRRIDTRIEWIMFNLSKKINSIEHIERYFPLEEFPKDKKLLKGIYYDLWEKRDYLRKKTLREHMEHAIQPSKDDIYVIYFITGLISQLNLPGGPTHPNEVVKELNLLYTGDESELLDYVYKSHGESKTITE